MSSLQSNGDLLIESRLSDALEDAGLGSRALDLGRVPVFEVGHILLSPGVFDDAKSVLKDAFGRRRDAGRRRGKAVD